MFDFYDLSWGSQLDAAVNNANKILGIVLQNGGTYNSRSALVRPILEYAALVWCPYPVKDILALVKDQRRAFRLSVVSVPSKRHSSACKGPEEGISPCVWTKTWGDGVWGTYQNVELAHLREAEKLGVENARVNPYNYSFFIRIVKEWNNLPQYVIEAESLKLFKTRFKSFLKICLDF